MSDRFLGPLRKPIQYSVNTIGPLRSGCVLKNPSDTGRTTFRSEAEQQGSIPSIAQKIPDGRPIPVCFSRYHSSSQTSKFAWRPTRGKLSSRCCCCSKWCWDSRVPFEIILLVLIGSELEPNISHDHLLILTYLLTYLILTYFTLLYLHTLLTYLLTYLLTSLTLLTCLLYLLSLLTLLALLTLLNLLTHSR